jgi:hypothetical protein
MLREYDLLSPLEGVSGLVIGLDKGVDLIANLARRGETRAGQGFGGENGEPDLHLIEPGGMGRGKMKIDHKHHCVLGRLQVEPDNVGRLLRKSRIGADTPTAPPRHGCAVVGRGHAFLGGFPCLDDTTFSFVGLCLQKLAVR